MKRSNSFSDYIQEKMRLKKKTVAELYPKLGLDGSAVFYKWIAPNNRLIPLKYLHQFCELLNFSVDEKLEFFDEYIVPQNLSLQNSEEINSFYNLVSYDSIMSFRYPNRAYFNEDSYNQMTILNNAINFLTFNKYSSLRHLDTIKPFGTQGNHFKALRNCSGFGDAMPSEINIVAKETGLLSQEIVDDFISFLINLSKADTKINILLVFTNSHKLSLLQKFSSFAFGNKNNITIYSCEKTDIDDISEYFAFDNKNIETVIEIFGNCFSITFAEPLQYKIFKHKFENLNKAKILLFERLDSIDLDRTENSIIIKNYQQYKSCYKKHKSIPLKFFLSTATIPKPLDSNAYLVLTKNEFGDLRCSMHYIINNDGVFLIVKLLNTDNDLETNILKINNTALKSLLTSYCDFWSKMNSFNKENK